MEREKKVVKLQTLKNKNASILKTSLVDSIPLGHYSQSAKAQMYLSVPQVHTHICIILYNDPRLLRFLQ